MPDDKNQSISEEFKLHREVSKSRYNNRIIGAFIVLLITLVIDYSITLPAEFVNSLKIIEIITIITFALFVIWKVSGFILSKIKISIWVLIICVVVLLVSIITMLLNNPSPASSIITEPTGKNIIPVDTPIPKQYLEIINHEKFYYTLAESKLTTAQKISKYNSYVGKYVRWYMPVVDVKDNYVSLGSKWGKQVYLYDVENSILMSLKPDQKVLFEGMITQKPDAYIEYDNYLVSLDLQNGKIFTLTSMGIPENSAPYLSLASIKSDGTAILNYQGKYFTTIFPNGAQTPS